ncbi:MAG: hypothetical protein KKD44_01385 [Proteobacteria bacterium]|nr:hypothetical protein [Pseudomonadota bacterium]
MTTIPSLNIVIQQGDSVRESHNIKNQTLDAAQHASFQRLEEEDKKRTMVSQTQETEKIRFNKDTSSEGKPKQDARSSNKKKHASPSEESVEPDSTGRLLNTIV